MRFYILFLLLLIGATPLNGGTDAAAFLDIEIGARAMAMGGSFVAISDDATATYWNPAGIGQLRSPEIVVATTGTALGMGGVLGSGDGLSKAKDRHQFAAYVQPFGRYGSLGIAFIGFGLDDIEQMDEDENVVGSFSDNEDAYILSYGLELVPKELFVGLDLKLLRQSFQGLEGYGGTPSATAFGGDIGLIYLPIRGLRLGLSSQKKTALKWQNGHSDEIPVRSRIGIAYSVPLSGLLVAADLSQKKGQSLKANLGAELKYSPGFLFQSQEGLGVSWVALRTGLSDLSLEKRYGRRSGPNLNFGAGIALRSLVGLVRIDYGADLGYFGFTNRYSLGLAF